MTLTFQRLMFQPALATSFFLASAVPASEMPALECASAIPVVEMSREAGLHQQFTDPSRQWRQIVRALERRARQVREAGLSESAEPDWADGDDDSQLTIDMIQRALVSRQHRDPFIDAYIRWQLLSYDPPFPELDERAFLRLLRELPALIENPRGEEAFLQIAERAETMDALSPSDFEQLQQLDQERTERMAFVKSLNRPAMEIRHWVRAGVEKSLIRTLQSLLEECAAKIDGAWPTRRVKSELSRTFTRATDELARSEKHVLADQAYRLVGHEGRFVRSITFFADRSINVSYARPRVTRPDYDRWMERLAGERKE